MCSACRKVMVLWLLAGGLLWGCGSRYDAPKAAAAPAPQRLLRITADPNNLPFSNEAGEGFENRIAEVLARELHAQVRYTWRAQRRGFFRHAMQEDRADLVLGVPVGYPKVLATLPYYRAGYVFVTRRDRHFGIESFDDPRLRSLRIGVQVAGDEEGNPPPIHALARRRIIDNLVGFHVYGDYRRPNPPARIMEAVAREEVEIACVWGPLAGYFATREGSPLEITPIAAVPADPGMTFAIAIAVRPDEPGLCEELNGVLTRCRTEIDGILDGYGVPRVGPGNAGGARTTLSEE